ncbi:hypothetical protein JOF41_002460 [Saccharothrix coeruleofusca]|uniref:DUF397 domain-containing protein n=1 Tax=Saccharothrix coeruleofusca TaxID=33919 RepID=UPI001AE1E17D|nr:DUF397 domain-containing protein [Saccharothrix coeruleofusca]MBP2336282.1 hypothetical protein [Saccharothrix coeruleofusca]
MTEWRKSTRSSTNTNCVEVRRSLNAVRDSKNPAPALTVSPAGLTVFLEAAKRGRFDR